MRRDRIGPPCRGSGRRTSPSCAPVHPFCHPLRARGPARGLPAATGSLANPIGRAKTAEGLGRAFSPAFRARAWVPKNLARRVLIYWFRRRDAARPDRAAMPRIGPANLSIVRPRLPLLSPSTRARARPWSARCYGVARQRDRSRQNSRGPRACFLCGLSGSRVGAEESGAASKRKTRRLLTNRPCSSLVYEESDSKERLRVSNWIVQRLYNYAVKKTVEL